MQRDYMRYVGEALKNGMTPQEMQSLFNEMESKSNTKQGKRVLRLFAKGIGKTKKKSLIRQQQNNQIQNTQQKGYQYVYKQN